MRKQRGQKCERRRKRNNVKLVRRNRRKHYLAGDRREPSIKMTTIKSGIVHNASFLTTLRAYGWNVMAASCGTMLPVLGMRGGVRGNCSQRRLCVESARQRWRG